MKFDKGRFRVGKVIIGHEEHTTSFQFEEQSLQTRGFLKHRFRLQKSISGIRTCQRGCEGSFFKCKVGTPEHIVLLREACNLQGMDPPVMKFFNLTSDVRDALKRGQQFYPWQGTWWTDSGMVCLLRFKLLFQILGIFHECIRSLSGRHISELPEFQFQQSQRLLHLP